MTFSSEKMSIFTAKISDELFCFLSLTRFFGFSLSFPRFSVSFTMLNVVYDPFLTRTTTISEKNSFMTPFLPFSYFGAHPTTLFLKILGGRMHGPCTQPQIFWGTVPQFPPRSPLLPGAFHPSSVGLGLRLPGSLSAPAGRLSVRQQKSLFSVSAGKGQHWVHTSSDFRDPSRVRPKLGFGYGFGAETAKFLGFGLVSVTAVKRILVSAWFRLRP